MCDVNGRLIEWLDHELPQDEADEVERHVQGCAECRGRVSEYERTSFEFNAYCDVACAAEVRQEVPRWKMAVVGIGAIAAVVVLAFLASHPRARLTPSPVNTVAIQAPPVPVAEAAMARALPRETGTSKKRARKGRSMARIRKGDDVPAPAPRDANSMSAGPAVQITIPAEAVLPPGAVPPGASFVVEMSIAPDGMAQGVRLSPQLAGFERRASQP